MNKHNLLKDMRSGCGCQDFEYCPLEAIIHGNPRIFEQHKLVEKFKFLRSELLGREVEWGEAYFLWVEEGYAKKFSEVYKEEYNHKELEERIKGELI